MIDDLLIYIFQSEMLYYVKEITGNIRRKFKKKKYIQICH